MEKETNGKVIKVTRQWWLKINTKSVRIGPLDGAKFPHIIKVSYTVDGREYVKRKWLGALLPVPSVGESVKVVYREEKPQRAKIFFAAADKVLL